MSQSSERGCVMLNVKNLTVSFPAEGEKVTPIDDLYFKMDYGEILGLVGRSGCGKTVLSTVLMGMLEYPGFVSQGEVLYKPKGMSELDLIKLDEKEWQKLRGREIAMIEQDSMQALNPSRKIGSQFVEAIRVHRKNLSKSECISMAKDAFEKVFLYDPDKVMKSYPFELSGGMSQRVLIAIGLIHKPSLLVADESTTALDVKNQAQVLKVFQSAREELGTAILFISHDSRIVESFADRVISL